MQSGTIVASFSAADGLSFIDARWHHNASLTPETIYLRVGVIIVLGDSRWLSTEPLQPDIIGYD